MDNTPYTSCAQEGCKRQSKSQLPRFPTMRDERTLPVRGHRALASLSAKPHKQLIGERVLPGAKRLDPALALGAQLLV